MVNNIIPEGKQGGPQPMDESWWAAVMAEEEKTGSPSEAEASSETGSDHAPQRKVNWEHARKIYECDETVTLEVIDYNRGGLLVEGSELQGFVPISHLVDIPCDPNKQTDDRERVLSGYLASVLTLKVIECDTAKGRVVFSERAALFEPGRRMQLLESLKPSEKIEGTVTNITDFGVFVDLGGVEGLIHVSELSWGRVRHPSDVVNIGDQVEVHVISVDKEQQRVALSLKRMSSNPWESAEMRYYPGQEVEAVITSVMPFGAFARLEEGLDGLIHVSEMSQGDELIRPHDVVEEGQSVQVRVLHVDANKQRLGLSLLTDPQT